MITGNMVEIFSGLSLFFLFRPVLLSRSFGLGDVFSSMQPDAISRVKSGRGTTRKETSNRSVSLNGASAVDCHHC